jgi:hypothetical protein
MIFSTSSPVNLRRFILSSNFSMVTKSLTNGSELSVGKINNISGPKNVTKQPSRFLALMSVRRISSESDHPTEMKTSGAMPGK